MEHESSWIFSLQPAICASPEQKLIHHLRSVLISSFSLFLEKQRHFLPSCTTAKHILTPAFLLVYKCYHWWDIWWGVMLIKHSWRNGADDNKSRKALSLLLCCKIRKLGSQSRAAHGHTNIFSRSGHSHLTVNFRSWNIFFASVSIRLFTPTVTLKSRGV